MPATKPYDAFRRKQGRVFFVAELSAFSRIGQRYKEVCEAYYKFRYPQNYLDTERSFLRAVKEAVDRASRGAKWPALDADLEARFGDKYRQLKLAIPKDYTDNAAKSKRGLKDYLKLLAVQADIHLASKTSGPDSSGAYDFTAITEARRAWAVNVLQSEQTQKRLEEGKRANPAGFRLTMRSMAEIAWLLIKLVTNRRNPAAFEKALEKHLARSARSPQFREEMERQKQHLERMRGTEVYPAMQKQIAEMELFMKDPGAWKAEMAKKAAEPAEEAEEDKPLPPGCFRFDCSGVKEPNPHQKELFDWLAAHQQDVALEVQLAVREMHKSMSSGVDLNDPMEQLLFPKDAVTSDVPLNCFQISEFILPKSGNRLGLTFETLFGHYQEHGCGLLIEDGKVTEYGEDEVLSGLELSEI